MTDQLSSRPAGKRFMIFATVAAAFCILSGSSAKAQPTTWQIAVVATGPGPQPTYVVIPPKGKTCDSTTSTQPTTGDVYVCQGDTVQWTANTTTAKNDMYIYDNDAVLVDQSNASPHGFHKSDNQPVTGTITNSKTGTHKYWVIVWDPSTGVLYVHDPTIIIGKGKQ
jgi:hypothetical protein